MDDISIAGRAEKLRRELEVIRQEESRTRSQRSHSLAEKAEHDKREARLLKRQNGNRATDRSGTFDGSGNSSAFYLPTVESCKSRI
jgi:hypothetical protein